MTDLLKAREEAFKLASETYKPGQTTYGKYSPIYLASTANGKDTMNLYKDYESVLTLGATGALGFEASLHGAKKVDMFDINELQRLFYEYMKTAITHLKYEEFIKYFTLQEQKMLFQKKEISNLLSNELYDKLQFFVPEDVEFVFGPLFDYFDSSDLIISGLFRFEHPITLDYLKRYVSFYNEEEYNKLQKVLRDEKCDFTYQTLDLRDVPNTFDSKYDLILLDNVLQYYKKIRGLETAYDVNLFISKELSKHLSENGSIQAAYGFEVACDALKVSQNIPVEGNRYSQTPFAQVLVKQELKEGICPQLVRKWDNYTYHFIPGVEQNENKNAENVVLTYKKRKKH